MKKRRNNKTVVILPDGQRVKLLKENDFICRVTDDFLHDDIPSIIQKDNHNKMIRDNDAVRKLNPLNL